MRSNSRRNGRAAHGNHLQPFRSAARRSPKRWTAEGRNSADLEPASEVPRRSRPGCLVARRASCPGRTQGKDERIRPSSSAAPVSGALIPGRVHCGILAGRLRRGGESRLRFSARENQSFARRRPSFCCARAARVRMASPDGKTQGARSEVAGADGSGRDAATAPAVPGRARQHRALGKGGVVARQTVVADTQPHSIEWIPRPDTRQGWIWA